MAAPSPQLSGAESPLAMVVLRVWREPHADGLRGRLIAPALAEPTSAAGAAQLHRLLDRALRAVEAELADAQPSAP